MERAILVIVLIVAVVGVVGLFSSYDFTQGADALGNDGVTGQVIASNAAGAGTCASCAGYAPVCAELGNRFVTFPNSCAAACAQATVVKEGGCLP